MRKRLLIFAVLVGLLALPLGPLNRADAGYENHTTAMTNPSSGNASTTLTVPKPSGVQAGNFLLAQITFEKGADAGTNAQLTPAGWTLVRRTNSVYVTN